MTPPEPRAAEEQDAASDAGESEAPAESPTTERAGDAAAEADAPSAAGESEAQAESSTEQISLPPEEAEAGAYATEAEVGAEAPADEPAVEEEAPGEVSTARRRAARTPAWAWVVITLMALLLTSGLITLAIVRNADPSTPEAVEDVQTLVVELEALNGYLATTNELMSNAISSAEQLSATAQAKLADLSAQAADADAGVGHARSLLGGQLSEKTRSELDTGQEQLQSLRQTLAERTARLEGQLLATISGAVAGLEDRVGVATDRGSSRAGASEARIAALESKQASDRRVQGSAPARGRSDQGRVRSAQGRGRSDQGRSRSAQAGRAAQGGRSAQGGQPGTAGARTSIRRSAPEAEPGPTGARTSIRRSAPGAEACSAGACARPRCSDPRAEADPGGAPADRRQAKPASLVRDDTATLPCDERGLER